MFTSGSFYGQYTMPSHAEKIEGSTYLQFLSLTSFTDSDYTLIFTLQGSTYQRSVHYLGRGATGLIITLEYAGHYKVEVINARGISEGFLKHGSSTDFDVAEDGSIIGDVSPPWAGGLSVGAIAGIVIAVIAVVAAAVVIYFFFGRRARIAVDDAGHHHLDSGIDEIGAGTGTI
jgi:hypothetical protein